MVSAMTRGQGDKGGGGGAKSKFPHDVIYGQPPMTRRRGDGARQGPTDRHYHVPIYEGDVKKNDDVSLPSLCYAWLLPYSFRASSLQHSIMIRAIKALAPISSVPNRRAYSQLHVLYSEKFGSVSSRGMKSYTTPCSTCTTKGCRWFELDSCICGGLDLARFRKAQPLSMESDKARWGVRPCHVLALTFRPPSISCLWSHPNVCLRS